MNILIYVHTLSHGGAEKQAILDANLLAEKLNVFLTFRHSGDMLDQVNQAVKIRPIKSNSYIKAAWELSRLIRREKIDIVHASLFAPKIISALASMFTKVKIIWAFHSHKFDAPLKSRVALKYFAKWKNISRLMFVSHELQESFAKRKCQFGFQKHKETVLYNCTSFSNEKSPQRIITKEIIIGYVGRLVSLKRVDYLIDLASFLEKKGKDFKIIILGDGTEMELLRDSILKRNLNSHIQLLGFQCDLEKYYGQMDLFVLPSSEECLSLSLIDAGMAGVPAIAFNVGGNYEVVVNGKTGFIVDSKEEMMEKTLELIDDTEKHHQFSINAMQYCREHFGRNKHVEALLEMYREVFNEQKKQPLKHKGAK